MCWLPRSLWNWAHHNVCSSTRTSVLTREFTRHDRKDIISKNRCAPAPSWSTVARGICDLYNYCDRPCRILHPVPQMLLSFAFETAAVPTGTVRLIEDGLFTGVLSWQIGVEPLPKFISRRGFIISVKTCYNMLVLVSASESLACATGPISSKKLIEMYSSLMWAAWTQYLDWPWDSVSGCTESVTHFWPVGGLRSRPPHWQSTESDVRTWSRKESLERGVVVCGNVLIVLWINLNPPGYRSGGPAAGPAEKNPDRRPSSTEPPSRFAVVLRLNVPGCPGWHNYLGQAVRPMPNEHGSINQSLRPRKPYGSH